MKNLLSFFKIFGHGGIEIFENSTKDELKECGEIIKFVVNFKTEKIWCWNGGKEIFHRNVINDFLNMRSDSKYFIENCYAGTGSYKAFIYLLKNTVIY
ncbi:MAG: hypothetical protein ACOC56_00125 [Atribacterota bacterium]